MLLCVPADLDDKAAGPLSKPRWRPARPGCSSTAAWRRARRPADRAARPGAGPGAGAPLAGRFGGRTGLFLIASGGVHEPADALALRAAGADLVEVDSGLVYTGPGLPKRINDALPLRGDPDAGRRRAERAPEMTWFWTPLMGAGMLFGSLLALAIAMTRVVLPYDEAFVGMPRHELAAVNPRLLAFMAHDRVSLAGTMVAIGVMYLGCRSSASAAGSTGRSSPSSSRRSPGSPASSCSWGSATSTRSTLS